MLASGLFLDFAFERMPNVLHSCASAVHALAWSAFVEAHALLLDYWMSAWHALNYIARCCHC